MWIYFPNLAILKDWLIPMQLNPKKNYHNQHPTDQFFLLAIEVFGCVHK
jgi:hypothetical protein